MAYDSPAGRRSLTQRGLSTLLALRCLALARTAKGTWNMEGKGQFSTAKAKAKGRSYGP